MNVLILGGLGFLGINVTKGMLEASHSVTVVDMNMPAKGRKIDGCKYVVCSFDKLSSISSEFDDIDVVIHLISTTLPSTSNENIEHDISSNLLNTIELLHLCVEHNVKRVVFSSSGGTVYGIPDTIPISEDHPTNPICSYGIVKLPIEKYLQLFNRLYGLDYRILRISNPYGP
jgi:UDP-glucose 4-epimerase